MTYGGSRPMQPGGMAFCSLHFKGDYSLLSRWKDDLVLPGFALFMVSPFALSIHIRRAELGAGFFLSLGALRGSDDLMSCKRPGPGETDQKRKVVLE